MDSLDTVAVTVNVKQWLPGLVGLAVKWRNGLLSEYIHKVMTMQLKFNSE